jgi:superfamily II DNA/RNA helicase
MFACYQQRPPETCHIGEDLVPNSTARTTARASKPRHQHTADRARGGEQQRYNPRHDNQADQRGNTWSNDAKPARRGGKPTTRRDNDTWSDNRGSQDRDRRGSGGSGGSRDSWSDDRGSRGDRQGTWPNKGGRTQNRSAAGERTNTWAGRRDTRDDRPGTGEHRPSHTTGHRAGRDGWQQDRYPRTDRPGTRTDHGRRDQHGTDRPSGERGRTDGRGGAPVVHWDGEITEETGSKGASASFADLGLPTPLLHALEEAGITEPFPIQSATLPDALAGRDVLGRAQTGSGKTLAFGLALITRLNKGKTRPRQPRGLVLVPTRELAMQVADALTPLAKSLGLWCRTVVGGMSFGKQSEQLQRGVDLLIATPGRLSDHVRQGTCVLDDVHFVALDEADQMADMGFLPQVRAILDLVPDGQRMLFSATLDRDVASLVDQYLTNPVTHSVSPATATVSTMDHHLLLVSREDKQDIVAEMAARDGRTIMFLRTKHHVDRLTKHLREIGVRAGALHGGKPQGARNRVLGEFKDGRLPVLIATDVAARGIHVDGVSLVVHVDPPADAKGYLHRAGRTARAGEAGTVVTLVTHQERRTVFRMTEQAGVSPERTKVRPGDDDLARITGAQTPSGEPVVDPEPTRRPPRPNSRFNRPGGRPRRNHTR